VGSEQQDLRVVPGISVAPQLILHTVCQCRAFGVNIYARLDRHVLDLGSSRKGSVKCIHDRAEYVDFSAFSCQHDRPRPRAARTAGQILTDKKPILIVCPCCAKTNDASETGLLVWAERWSDPIKSFFSTSSSYQKASSKNHKGADAP